MTLKSAVIVALLSLLAPILSNVNVAHATDAVLDWDQNQINIAIKGVNGYIPAPVPSDFLPSYQLPAHKAGDVMVAADQHNIYLLSATGALTVTHGAGSYLLYDQLSIYDYNSPTPLRSISLPGGVTATAAALDGLVYTITPAGQLYATNPETGSTTNVGTVSPPIGPSAEYGWSLRAHSNVGLLAAARYGFSSSVSLVDPNTAAVIRSNVVNDRGLPQVLSIDSSGQFARFGMSAIAPDATQRRMDLPSLLVGDTLQPNDQIPDAFVRHNVTDDIVFPYQPTMPALVQLAWRLTSPTPNNVLIRTPRTLDFSAELDVANYALPPGMVISNVHAATLAASASGPGLVQIISEPAPMPALTLGPLGTNRVHIGLTAASAPGVYSVNFSTGSDPLHQVTADRTVAGETTPGAALRGPSSSTWVSFAYDPVSDNLVGNGAFSMYLIGWTGDALLDWAPNSENLDLVLSASDQVVHESQALELPLAAGPMRFSADIEGAWITPLIAGADAPVLVLSINGIEEARWALEDGANQPLQALVDDPRLYGFTGADFDLKLIAPGYDADLALDNLILTAVPEPLAPLYAAVAAALVLRPDRRRSSRCSLAEHRSQ